MRDAWHAARSCRSAAWIGRRRRWRASGGTRIVALTHAACRSAGSATAGVQAISRSRSAARSVRDARYRHQRRDRRRDLAIARQAVPRMNQRWSDGGQSSREGRSISSRIATSRRPMRRSRVGRRQRIRGRRAMTDRVGRAWQTRGSTGVGSVARTWRGVAAAGRGSALIGLDGRPRRSSHLALASVIAAGSRSAGCVPPSRWSSLACGRWRWTPRRRSRGWGRSTR